MKKGPRLVYAATWGAVLAAGVTLFWGVVTTFVFLPEWRQQGKVLAGWQVLLLRMPLILYPVVFVPTFLVGLWWFRREDRREDKP